MYINAMMDGFAALVVAVLLLATLRRKQDARTKPYFCGLLCSHFLLLVIDAGTWLLQQHPDQLLLLKTLWIADEVFLMVDIAFFHYYLCSYLREHHGLSIRYSHVFVPTICLVTVAAWALSMSNGMFYYLDGNAVFHYTELHWLSQLGGEVFIVVDMVIVLKNCRKFGTTDTLVWLSYGIVPLLALVIDRYISCSLLYPAVTISVLLLYSMINVEQNMRLAQREAELSDSRTQIMISQIQPHFLYNSLNSIYQLCGDDPQLARKAIDDFATYLRMNLDSLKKKTPVPFDEELKHIQTYLRMEQMRFGDRLKVEYDIKCTQFCIPALSVQPLVENAVKHGICQRENGGTVTIAAYEEPECYTVVVSDNGVGFDPDRPIEDDKTHIGIENVAERLQLMSRGELRIDSTPDVGTVATICIPKEERL